MSLEPPPRFGSPQGPPGAYNAMREHFLKESITSLEITICSLEIHRDFFKSLIANGRSDLTDLIISGAQILTLHEDALNFAHQLRYPT